MPAPMAILKGIQIARQVGGALGDNRSSLGPPLTVAVVAFSMPALMVMSIFTLGGSLFGVNDGASTSSCNAAFGGGASYSFSLPAWDRNSANRERTKDLSAVPGPVPETYDNRGRSVQYLRYMQTAEEKYGVPWYLLAAMSWQETRHGADPTTWDRNQSSDNSYGPMQFIPGTWRAYGVDGDSDGAVSDESVGDQIHAAANLLVRNGFLDGTEGVLRAIRAYNPHETYRNDVLFWAEKYAGGGSATVVNNELCSGLDSEKLAGVVAFVISKVGYPYVWGAEGPDAFDCSGLMFAAYQTAGVTLGRRAVDQADDEQIEIVKRRPVSGPDGLMPGDLLFIDNGSRNSADHSSRLLAYIGHVAMYIGNGEVVEAANPSVGVVRRTYDAGRWANVMGVGRVKGMVAAGGPGGPWARPVNGAVATSGFGMRVHPVTGDSKMHNGQDLGAGCGVSINAVADGTVIFASRGVGGYGQYIVIDHGGGFHTGYGHQQAMHVSVGQRVRRGQHIADVGTEGTSTGCHLHFNTLTGASNDPWSGTYVDPRPLLVQHGVDYWGDRT